MILVNDCFREWCGDLSAIELVSATAQLDQEMILNASASVAGENFRVGPYICIELTYFEEQCLQNEFPKYVSDPAKYAGTYAAECVFDAMCGIRYGRPAFARPSADMINWETGDPEYWRDENV